MEKIKKGIAKTYKYIKADRRKESAVIAGFSILFLFIIWNLIFDWSAGESILFKTGDYPINHINSKVDIKIVKIDYLVLKKENGKIIYPHNGLFAVIHYEVINKLPYNINYSAKLPYINGSKKYYPVEFVNNFNIAPGRTAEDSVSYDLPYKTDGIKIESELTYHDFIIQKNITLDI